MSLFGAIDTAISGLTAQSSAFGNISENVANSQTAGFKRVDTKFVDYLTTSTPTVNEPGAVVARPDYINNVQGSITQTDNPLGMAIAGQGFFAVSQPTGEVKGVPTFNQQQFYSRAGDFTMNSTGYLVNSAGQYLNGWSVDPVTGLVNQNAVAPIQVNQSTYNPVKTQNVTISANLPATPTAGTALATPIAPATVGTPLSSQITVYDALGTAHAVQLNWTQNQLPPDANGIVKGSPGDWNVQIQIADATATATDSTISQDAGTMQVLFGATSGKGVPEGTIGQIQAPAGTAAPATTTTNPSITTGGYATGKPATMTFTTDFGSGPQQITLNLGTYGSSSGVTQYAGTAYSLLGLTQDGVPPGSFAGVSAQENGNVIVNYNNGQTRTIAQIPVVTFNAPDSLQSQNGQAFTATPASGTPLAEAAGSNGAGTLVTGSVEGSNVDIATEFSHLIVAQQAYSSNAKVVTTANSMLQTTLQMVA